MKRFQLIILLTLLIHQTSYAINDYYFVEEYYKLYPQQLKISQEFIKKVHTPSSKIEVSQNTPIKIYMVYPGEQISDYWKRSKQSFEERLKELGIKYQLKDYFTKPKIETHKQVSALYKALEDDTDYLIFTLDTKKHFKFISTIVNKEKPKLILQNITTPIKNLGDKHPFLYVGFDHTFGTKLLANEYLQQIKEDGTYAILYGPQGYVSKMRGDTFISFMKKNSKMKLLDSYYTDFNKQKAKLATYDLLKNHPQIDFIYACSTDIALGVSEVLKEKNLLGKIKVNGWGGGSSELDAILQNELDFTVMRMNDDNGIAMAEAIKLDLENKKEQIPLIFSGEFQLIKKGIDTKALQNLKRKAFRYSGI